MYIALEYQPQEGRDAAAPPLWSVTYINIDADRGMTISVDARTGEIVRVEER